MTVYAGRVSVQYASLALWQWSRMLKWPLSIHLNQQLHCSVQVLSRSIDKVFLNPYVRVRHWIEKRIAVCDRSAKPCEYDDDRDEADQHQQYDDHDTLHSGVGVFDRSTGTRAWTEHATDTQLTHLLHCYRPVHSSDDSIYRKYQYIVFDIDIPCLIVSSKKYWIFRYIAISFIYHNI